MLVQDKWRNLTLSVTKEGRRQRGPTRVTQEQCRRIVAYALLACICVRAERDARLSLDQLCKRHNKTCAVLQVP